MSYDLMVFDPAVAPKSKEEFLKWYWDQVAWNEDHDYTDHAITTPALRSWFLEMIEQFPPLNGPLATGECDPPEISDYNIGKHIIYIAFAWSVARQAHDRARELAIKHSLGFFHVSAEDGEILFPDGPIENDRGGKTSPDQKPWWKFW